MSNPIDVIGLVHPFGAGGGVGQNERRWTLSFTVKPWRVIGGDINDTELYIWQKGLTEQQLERKTNSIAGDTIIRVRVRFPKRQTDSPSAEMVKFLRKDNSDAEMNKRVKAHNKPSGSRTPTSASSSSTGR
jgi:DnaJ-class molecular chaperone